MNSKKDYWSQKVFYLRFVDDYPLRSKIVKLHVKRRKRTGQSSGEILQREWQLVARGTRMAKYLVSFLKKIADTKALPFNFCA